MPLSIVDFVYLLDVSPERSNLCVCLYKLNAIRVLAINYIKQYIVYKGKNQSAHISSFAIANIVPYKLCIYCLTIASLIIV